LADARQLALPTNGRTAQSSIPGGQAGRITQPLQAAADGEASEVPELDALDTYEQRAIAALQSDAGLLAKLRGDGVAWGMLKRFLYDRLPDALDNRDDLAYNLVRKALNTILGEQNIAWHTFRHPERNTTYVKEGKAEQGDRSPSS